MNPAALLYTSGLLGLLALAGGGYGSLYTVSKLQSKYSMFYGAVVCYAAVAALAALIAWSTPLAAGWKILIVASALIYAAVPPLTWRFLVKMHATREQHS